MERCEKIARRIVSSVYSWYTLEDNKAYMFMDGHSLPCYYVCRNSSKSYRVIKFDRAQFASQEGRNSINAILVALKTGNGGLLKAFRKYIKYDRGISAGKAVAPLLSELGMTLPDFEKMFHTDTDFTSGGGLSEERYRNWRIVFEKGVRNDVEPLLDKVDGLLGGFSKALSYGIVEIKNDLPPKVLADYTPKNDAMRVKSSSSDGRLAHCFIHELSHRLWFKKMSKEQRDEVKRKYNKMKDADTAVHMFEKGDDVELTDGMRFRVVYSNGVMMDVKAIGSGDGYSDGDIIEMPSVMEDDMIRRIDGELYDNGGDMFPSEYSKTSVEEFFAECFSYWRSGELCASLSLFLDKMFHKNHNS